VYLMTQARLVASRSGVAI